ncbi:MAG: enoyl-CoA hydratase [Rhizobiales bacterium]|nr:enoyl-CoA hydratase [Hyphomicrobiales bacterium]
METDAGDELLVGHEDGILRVVLNRPHARNALTFAMYERLGALLAGQPSDGSVKAVVITGAGGKAFAAGTDMGQFRVFESPADAHAYEASIERVLGQIEACPVPTIAAIAGACTGGGAAIAACCDLRLATADMRFGFPIARTLGNCLSAATLARLVALLGEARVRDLVLTARLIEAEEARSIGLVSDVLADVGDLEAATAALARRLAGHAPLTMRATREALARLRRAGPRVDDSDLVTLCYMSEDFRGGIEAFLGKRPPVWKGR